MADRSSWLGGSDAAAVLGVDPYRTPVDLWLEKTRRKVENLDDFKRAMVLARGRRLEPVIREMAIDKLRAAGHQVKLLAKNRRYRDAKHRFLSAEIDFELEVDGEEVNGDAKSVSHFVRDEWGDPGSEDVPIHYAAQFMHGLMVHPRRRQRTLVAALRSLDDVDLYWTRRDEVTIEAMRERELRFWTDHVKAKVPPEPTSLDDIRGLFPKSRPAAIEATPEIATKVAELRELQKQAKDIVERETLLRFQIGQFMGDHALLTAGVRDLLTFEEQTRSSFDLTAFRRKHPDWEAMFTRTSTTRVLRFAARRG
ncbi:YqaJ viral recombinase family nuclease [Piscinibacter defluvii]|uniref:YqaJ viral recombinase family nuclease n=1 Tax=Piscinibacter defluvii TaxID=1796922 RepID=UPI0013E3016A|nr:YqaJ viral recombinase family protein [Piscinibacter defluvii]